MKKENLMMPTAGVAIGPITRARAAAAMSKLQDHKLPLTNLKRAASDERNGSTSSIACNQPKKRALLKDITNVTCDNLYRNCLNASKIPSKRKEGRKGSVILPKTTPSVVPGPDKNPPTKSNEVVLKNFCEGSSKLSTRESVNLLQYPGVSVKEGNALRYGKSVLSATQDFTDIDANQRDPQLCCLYASDIYSYLHVAEIHRRPSFSYMETFQEDITQTMRAILVDWLVEVCEEYNLVPDTLYLTVYLIDKFLSRQCITSQRLQLLGITCLLIASKFEEIYAPRVEELCFITECTYTKHEVIELESQVLNILDFNLSVPTAKTFLRRFLHAAESSYDLTEDLNQELEFLANYLTELTLIHYGFLEFLPSAIAASAIFLARWTLKQSGHLWNGTLEHYTRYKASNLKTTVFALQRLLLSSDACPSNAIRAKYHQDKYKNVAALNSPTLQDSLFQK